MKPELITFDCAGTLVDAKWQPGKLAIDCLKALGRLGDEQEAKFEYDSLVRSRWPEFQELNLQRDEVLCDQFWADLTACWLKKIESDVNVEDWLKEAEKQLYGPNSKVFTLFEDVMPTLDRLHEEGYRMAIISNWDVSLHRVVRTLGLTNYFEQIVASLEEGVEKPDPRLFHMVINRANVPPEKCLHVGDHPLDDFHGARQIGMRAILIDRAQPRPSEVLLNDLRMLPEVISSTT